jgi:hypothetical protein
MSEGLSDAVPDEPAAPPAAAAGENADRLPRLTKRRWGYIVWGVALGFVFIPELLAAVQAIERHLPFTTISAMVGHLEYENALWELGPTALTVFALYSLLRTPPKESSGGHTVASIQARADQGDVGPHRTAGGRLTFQPSETSTGEFDESRLDGWRFGVRAAVVAGVIIGLTLWAADHWPTPKGQHAATNFHVGYVLYGSIAFFWLLLPSLDAFIRGKDASYPTLFRTITNLEEWLAGWGPQRWRRRLGKVLAWIVSYVLLWGLVFLMIHLALYPFPDITHILNPTGR